MRAGWNSHNKTDAAAKTVGLRILREYHPVEIDMPETGTSGEFTSKDRSTDESDQARRHNEEHISAQGLTAWRTSDSDWKARYDAVLPPGNYTIHTHETDTEAAHTTVATLFDGLTDYEIWATRDVYTSAKARRRDEPAYKHVLVRTAQPIPVAHLPDIPRITSY